MAVPSSPTRRQTGFQLPASTNQFNGNMEKDLSNFSTRSRNDTQDTITQTQQHIKDHGTTTQLQPLPIPGTIATQQHHQQLSRSPSDLPTPPDAESNFNLSIQSSSHPSQPELAAREVEILKPSNHILSSILPPNGQVLPIQQSYPDSASSSGPGSLSSSAGVTSVLAAASNSNRNFSSLNHNYSTSVHSSSHSQPRNSFTFGYSPYSNKSSYFKTSAERGVPRSTDVESTPDRDAVGTSSSSRMMEGEGSGDSAGVFSFSSPHFGPQSITDEDVDFEHETIVSSSSTGGPSRSRTGEEIKSPGWTAVSLGQLSLGSPDFSSLSTTPYSTSISNQNGSQNGSMPKSSTMMSLGSSSSSSTRRYPPSSSSASNFARPNNSRGHSHHSPSSFNSGSPASRSLPSADAAIHAAAMHRRASYNRTASGAQRPGLIQNGHHQYSLGLSPGSPSPIGIAAHSIGRSRHPGGGVSRRANERSNSRSRYTSRGPRKSAAAGRNDEIDEDATDEDEMVLDLDDVDKDRNHPVDDDDTEDEMLDDHSGSITGSNIESSVIGEMDTDAEMDESEIGSTYGGEDMRMKDSNVNGWDIYSNNGNGSRSLSGYYTSSRGEYVSSPSGSGGIPTGPAKTSNPSQNGSSRPYLLDRVNRSSSSGTSPSLGLSLSHGGGFSNGMTTSFGTSPSSFGRHHPYASSFRTNSNSGGVGNHTASPSARSISSSTNHDVQSNSLPAIMGIGVSPLGKSANSRKTNRGVSRDRGDDGALRRPSDEEMAKTGDDVEADDEAFDERMEEDLRIKVNGLSVDSNDDNSTISARPKRKSNSIRRASFRDPQYEYDPLMSSDSTNQSNRSANTTMKDLESIISSSPNSRKSQAIIKSNSQSDSTMTTATISAAGIREKLGGSSNCSAFISKLWHLMSTPEQYGEYITWSASGDSIILFNDQERQDIFAKEILPKLFKHGNVASFVRQLNLYGFQRVPTSRSLDSAEQEMAVTRAGGGRALASSPPSRSTGRPKANPTVTNAGAFYGSHSAFVHPSFMRGGEDNLSSMKPRSSKGKKAKDDAQAGIGDVSTSPANQVPKNSMSRERQSRKPKSKAGETDQDEDSDDEDDLAFD